MVGIPALHVQLKTASTGIFFPALYMNTKGYEDCQIMLVGFSSSMGLPQIEKGPSMNQLNSGMKTGIAMWYHGNEPLPLIAGFIVDHAVCCVQVGGWMSIARTQIMTKSHAMDRDETDAFPRLLVSVRFDSIFVFRRACTCFLLHTHT
jgi:hypothetical protein